MLATLNDVLPSARAAQYCVPAFDCVEDIMVRTILETCQEERCPAIIMALEGDLKGNGMVYISALVRGVAACHDIPVVLHLDHARNLELVRSAMDHGFTSVMFDGSALPFEENVRLTRQAVEMAHPRGISVEAELGCVGGMTLDDKQQLESVLTEPHEVVKFVQQTRVDALAVSIGTAHGVYRSLPVLNIQRLREIKACCETPLVLHGGSGTPADQVQEAIRNGITKLNLYADMRCAMYEGLKKSAGMHARIDPLPEEMFKAIKESLSAAATRKIRMVFANGRVPPGAGPAAPRGGAEPAAGHAG